MTQKTYAMKTHQRIVENHELREKEEIDELSSQWLVNKQLQRLVRSLTLKGGTRL